MKILITTDLHLPSVNGVVTSYLCLVSGLMAKGHDVRVLTLSPNRRTYVEDNTYYIGSFGAEFIYPGIRARRLLPHPKIVKAIKEWAPDVIHAQCEFNSFHYAKTLAKKLGIPLLLTAHTVYEDYFQYMFRCKAPAKVMVSWFSRFIGRRVDTIIAPTEKTKALMESYRVKNKIAVIPTGLELKELTVPVSDEEIRAIKAKLGIPESAKVMLSLGRVAEEKNIPELFSLLEQPALEDAILLIVGDGPYRAKLEKTVAEKPYAHRVIFAGMIPHADIAPYYRLGDVFVNASHSETQGLTFIESMAFGVPVVCMKDPCVEGVVMNGDTGYACENHEEMVEAVAKVLTDKSLHSHLAEQGKALVERRFTKEAFADAVEQEYLSAIPETRYKKK